MPFPNHLLPSSQYHPHPTSHSSHQFLSSSGIAFGPTESHRKWQPEKRNHIIIHRIIRLSAVTEAKSVYTKDKAYRAGAGKFHFKADVFDPVEIVSDAFLLLFSPVSHLDLIFPSDSYWCVSHVFSQNSRRWWIAPWKMTLGRYILLCQGAGAGWCEAEGSLQRSCWVGSRNESTPPARTQPVCSDSPPRATFSESFVCQPLGVKIRPLAWNFSLIWVQLVVGITKNSKQIESFIHSNIYLHCLYLYKAFTIQTFWCGHSRSFPTIITTFRTRLSFQIEKYIFVQQEFPLSLSLRHWHHHSTSFSSEFDCSRSSLYQ